MKNKKHIALSLVGIIALGVFSACDGIGNSSSEETSKWENVVDFTVEAKDEEFKILQLTDPQIIDGNQVRPGREGDFSDQTIDKVDKHAFNCMDYVIQMSNPDLILVTGDLIYGEFDDNGTVWQELISFMDLYEIPWAPVFGNHEAESKMGTDWQCQQLKNSKYCLFKQRELSGNGNYTVGVTRGEELLRVFYMMDTNGNYNASPESISNGHTITENGLYYDQIEWYEESIQQIKNSYTNTKFSIAMHIPIQAFNDALSCYGYNGQEDFRLDIDECADKKTEDFGYVDRTKSAEYWDKDYNFWNSIKANGIDSVFVGHIHANTASVVYDGIRLGFGLKCSTYDSTLYKTSTEKYKLSYWNIGEPVVGATQIKLSADGNIADTNHIYYKA